MPKSDWVTLAAEMIVCAVWDSMSASKWARDIHTCEYVARRVSLTARVMAIGNVMERKYKKSFVQLNTQLDLF